MLVIDAGRSMQLTGSKTKKTEDNTWLEMNSYFQDIEYHIIKHIQLAKSRLLIAVAWFTNDKIGDTILTKAGLDIELIIDDNKVNRNSTNLSKLLSSGVDITFVRDLNKKYYLMHNKFCVIDNRIVITGSYNWTYNANLNDENITIINDETNAAFYMQEFRRLKNIEFPNYDITSSPEHTKEITGLIYSDLLLLLRGNIDNLKSGLFFKWTNERIKNRMRTINEELRNNIISRLGHHAVYSDLIAKYGLQYSSLASEAEKIEARDKFRKKGLEELEHCLYREYQYFKLKAIKKLLDSYTKLIEYNENDPSRLERILKVHQFITREKMDISTDIDVTIVL